MTNIGLSTHIGTKKLSNFLMNASGPKCTLHQELSALSDCEYNGAIVSKSATLREREGNPSPRYADLPLGSINAMGLPNKGIDYYLEFPQIKTIHKPYWLSIAGLTLEENIHLLNRIQNASIIPDFVELNLSCPNIIGKPQIAYDICGLSHYLTQIFTNYKNKNLGIKLPPYFDLIHFEEVAKILKQFPIAFLTCINSIGNALYIDTEEDLPMLLPKNGLGGLGGSYIKPTALANVRIFYNLLPDIPIIGCGGIVTGKDAYEHILCGASAVQIGTCFHQEGIRSFQRITTELKTIMQEKNLSHLADFKGKLNVRTKD